MGRITDEDVTRVRDATDLISVIGERVVLRQKGRLFWGLCPFHGEKTPSFKVDPATQLWHCFGCGLGGDVFGFVMKTDNVEFPDSVRMLADRANIELHEEQGGVPRGHKERLFAVLDETAEFYHRALTGSREGSAAAGREYLANRGFGSDVAKSWRLGYAQGRGSLTRHLTGKGYSAEELVDANVALRGDDGSLKDRFYDRIMFPIADLQGRVIAFGGRVVNRGEPKYLNTNDTPVFHKSANLYAIDRAKGPITATGTAIVAEGYTDVIALHEAGFTSTVAALGTALTRQHVKLLGRFAKRIVYLFDGDEAGLRAADRAVEFVDRDVTPEAGNSRVELAVAVLPQGLDPADFVAQQGADSLRAVIESAEPLLRFAIDRRLARWDLDRPEERARALKDAAAVLAPIKESLLASDYANYIADRLFTDQAIVARAVMQSVAHAPSDRVAGVETQPQPAQPVVTPRQRAERELLGLLVRTVRLRERARQLLADNLLADESHVEMAKVIAEVGRTVSASVLVGRLDDRVPGAAAALAGAEVDADDDARAEVLADDLTRRIKEFELERRIAAGKARLKQGGSLKDPLEYDEVFRELASLEQQLAAVRRRAGD